MDWTLFMEKLDDLILLNQPLKTEFDIETTIVKLTRTLPRCRSCAIRVYKAPQGKNCATHSQAENCRKRQLRKQFQQEVQERIEFNKVVAWPSGFF